MKSLIKEAIDSLFTARRSSSYGYGPNFYCNRLQKLFFLCVAYGIALGLPTHTMAESSNTSKQKPSYVKFDIESRATPLAHVDGENILSTNTFFSASSGYPITRQHIFLLSVDFFATTYDWQNLSWSASEGQPNFALAHSYGITPGFLWKVNEKSTLLFFNHFQASEAGDSNFADTLSYSGSLILSRKMSASLKLSAVLFVQYQLDNKWSVLPVPAFSWQANPDFKIELSGRSGGPFLRGSLKARSKTQIFAEGRFEKLKYQTQNANNEQAIFSDQAWIALAGLQYQQRPKWYWEVSTGINFARALRLDPQSGAELEISTSASPLVLFKTHFEF